VSRSNPTEGARNPATRWFEWAGGDDGGFIRWYNKDTKQSVKVDGPFTFLLLDELATVKGWHDPSESGIYANEVRDTRQEALVVRSFKGGELVSGIYSNIKDTIAAKGGHFVTSAYLAYKEGDSLKIGNLHLKGAALSAWMEFKKAAPTKKDMNGKSLKAYFIDAVKIAEFEQLKKGATTFRVPKFALVPVSEATNAEASALDAELQSFLSDYFKRPKAEASKPEIDPHENPPIDDMPLPNGRKSRFDDMPDDIPF
jgi:hypothetical protein